VYRKFPTQALLTATLRHSPAAKGNLSQGEMKMECRSKDAAVRQMFGRRKVVPIVCIVDAKQHVRAFLKTDLDELGFIVCESSNIDDLAVVVEARRPD
jgi:hypothetical protein